MHAPPARVQSSAEDWQERPTGATPARVDVAAGLQAIVAPLVAELAEARPLARLFRRQTRSDDT